MIANLTQAAWEVVCNLVAWPMLVAMQFAMEHPAESILCELGFLFAVLFVATMRGRV